MTMKRFKTILAAIMALLTLGCSATDNQSSTNSQNNKNMEKQGKTLVVFFSHAGENYSVGNIEVGNTKIVADYISQLTGADQFEIVADKDYDMPYMQLIDVAKQEANDGELPAMVGKLENVDQYDTIFIGGPVWWGTYPQVMFLSSATMTSVARLSSPSPPTRAAVWPTVSRTCARPIPMPT